MNNVTSKGSGQTPWGRLLGRNAKERRLRLASLMAIAAGLIFAAGNYLFDPLESVQRFAADAQFREMDGSPNIVLVGIDDSALDEYGRLQQWPRALHAQVISNLTEAGARVIVYDILFADTGVDDQVLADAIARSENVVLPVAGDGLSSSREGLLVYESFVEPIEELQKAGAVLAHANLVQDDDGRMRRLPLVVRSEDGEERLALSLAATYLQFGREPPAAFEGDRNNLELFGRTVPMEEDRTLRVNYVGGRSRFNYLPFAFALDGAFEPSLVRNNIVIVGVTATGADIHSAPLLESAHGMEIHANALDTILQARFLRPASDGVTLATVALFVFLASVILPRQRVGFSLAALVALIGIYIPVGVLVFRQGYILDFAAPPAGLALVTIVGLAYRVTSERASQRELQELFGRYVSPEVATELVHRAERGELHLGGERREVTILFADIRGFTPLSARMEPGELVELLNQRFEVIVSRIISNEGIVNKFAGDAVMAIWNAPQDQPNHALLACRAALEAQDALDEFPDSGPPVRFGIGLNSGIALAGNVGSGRRLEYTVIGSPVNMAARLAAASAPGEIWIGADTYSLVRESIDAEELPGQHLKGFDDPVLVYRLKRGVLEPTIEVGG